MPPKPLGDVAMTAAERQRRRRDKAKALRDAAPTPPAGRRGNSGPADYPRMLFHPDGRTTVAETPKEHDRLTLDGWETTPLDIHRQRPVAYHGVLGADHPFVLPWRSW